MVKSVNVISVFCASPGDVAAERKSLETVVKEVNLMSASSNARIELLKWETHVHPGAGTDAQNVINEQLNDDYDVFLGIFWSRIGTPTPRAKSGTIEEFERAYQRFKDKPGSVEIMIYLKDEPVPPSQIDTKQLEELKEFSRRLGELGILHKPFKSTAEFEELTRVHLSHVLSGFARRASDPSSTELIKGAGREAYNAASAISELDDPDVGLLDLEEIFQTSVESMTAAQAEIQKATERLNAALEAQVPLFQSSLSNSEKKRLLDQAADEIVGYSSAVERLVPQMRESQQKMSFAAVRHITYEGGVHVSEEARQALIHSLDELLTTYESTSQNVRAMRDSADSLPRLTATLNRARKRVVVAQGSLLDMFATGTNLLLTIKDALQAGAGS